jgi:hypothetical protein
LSAMISQYFTPHLVNVAPRQRGEEVPKIQLSVTC